MKKKPTVALLFGGRGHEHDISLMGADYLYSLVNRELFDPLPVYITKGGTWLISPKGATPGELAEGKCDALAVAPMPLEGSAGLIALTQRGTEYGAEHIPVSVAFPLLHGDRGEDGEVQGALKNAGIPLVGEDLTAAAIAADKAKTKLIARALGIATADWITHRKGEPTDLALDEAEKRFGYPVFIKPTSLGSSIGASPAKDRAEARVALKHAAELGGEVIIEPLIEVERELECAFYSSESKELFTEPGEIRCGTGFYDYGTKYKDGTARVSARACVPREISDRIRAESERLVRALGIRDLCRVDFLLSRDGRLYFNEINTMPGFTADSLYPRLLSAAGLDPAEAVTGLLHSSMARG